MVLGEKTQVYPFVLPCSFRPEWVNLRAAAHDMGMDLSAGEPVRDEDSIARSIIRSWFATADGCVYTARTPAGGITLMTEQLPIRVGETWIQDQLGEVKASPDAKTLIAASLQHGLDSELDHEAGDLQDYLRAGWKILSSSQRTELLQHPRS